MTDSNMPDSTAELTLREVCERCMVNAEHIIALVDYGVVEPRGGSYAEWRFSARSYLTLRKALRLQKDLALNESGVALAIELLEKLQTANEEVSYLRQRIARWESGEQ